MIVEIRTTACSQQSWSMFMRLPGFAGLGKAARGEPHWDEMGDEQEEACG